MVEYLISNQIVVGSIPTSRSINLLQKGCYVIENMFKSIKRGMEILEPYLGDFDVDPVPDSYGNGEAKSSHLVTISVTVGEKEEAKCLRFDS